MEAQSYSITSKSATNRWGYQVLDLTLEGFFTNPGGQPFSEIQNLSTFITPTHIYEVEILGRSNDSNVNNKARQIFDRLYFYP